MYWIAFALIFAGLLSNGIKALLVLCAIALIGVVVSKCIDRFM